MRTPLIALSLVALCLTMSGSLTGELSLFSAAYAQSPDEICIRRHQCDVCGCVGLESRTGIAAAQPQPEATEEHFGMGADERAGRQHELVVRACGQSAVCGTAQETGYGCPVVLRRCRRDTKQERTCGEDHHACEHFASRVLRRTAAAPS